MSQPTIMNAGSSPDAHDQPRPVEHDRQLPPREVDDSVNECYLDTHRRYIESKPLLA